MTDKKELAVTEGNKLIADFIGYEWPSEEFYTGNELLQVIQWEIQGLKYHHSWDWLMHACHKWDNLNMYDKDGYEYEYSILCDVLDAKVSMYEIGPVWQQLVENIQWYNNQTPTK